MAARRLLIIMLILLGLSTLAAALVPQRTLRDGRPTTGAATTQTAPTTTQATPLYLPPTKITVGGKKFPVVAPVHVGDQLTLLVRSRFPAQIEIPEFGLIRFATPDTPARFVLLADTPGTFGILFGASPRPGVTGRAAARIVVVRPGAEKKSKRKAGNPSEKPAKSPALAG